MNAALQEKEDSIRSIVDASSDALKIEHDAEMKSSTENATRAIRAEFEAKFGGELSREKADFAKDLEEKVKFAEGMTVRLETLESALKVSRAFESGSQQAHRLSALALALATKLETSRGAAEELAALKVRDDRFSRKCLLMTLCAGPSQRNLYENQLL